MSIDLSISAQEPRCPVNLCTVMLRVLSLALRCGAWRSRSAGPPNGSQQEVSGRHVTVGAETNGPDRLAVAIGAAAFHGSEGFHRVAHAIERSRGVRASTFLAACVTHSMAPCTALLPLPRLLRWASAGLA